MGQVTLCGLSWEHLGLCGLCPAFAKEQLQEDGEELRESRELLSDGCWT